MDSIDIILVSNKVIVLKASAEPIVNVCSFTLPDIALVVFLSK